MYITPPHMQDIMLNKSGTELLKYRVTKMIGANSKITSENALITLENIIFIFILMRYAGIATPNIKLIEPTQERIVTAIIGSCLPKYKDKNLNAV